ncbi:Regulatory protein [Streptantibioticus cattleyicolor NRRL 8057 = DSM 46488]|nr:Regulatory protein [Streptantibioticus cattleyicolor NRRL 8057 = DSM 46488]
MALVVAQEVPTSSTMALPHGPAGVGEARRRLREELYEHGAPDTVVDDAVLVLSELLSNAYRHARPLDDGHEHESRGYDGRGHDGGDHGGVRHDGRDGAHAATRGADHGTGNAGIRAAWRLAEDGLLTLEVTDGGGPTRPQPSSPSLTARGGRGLGIVGALSLNWGVRDTPGEVTVWAVLAVRGRHARREGLGNGGARLAVPVMGRVPELSDLLDGLG